MPDGITPYYPTYENFLNWMDQYFPGIDPQTGQPYNQVFSPQQNLTQSSGQNQMSTLLLVGAGLVIGMLLFARK